MKEIYKRFGSEQTTDYLQHSFGLWGACLWEINFNNRKANHLFRFDYDKDTLSIKYANVEKNGDLWYLIPCNVNENIDIVNNYGIVVKSITLQLDEKYITSTRSPLFRYVVRIKNKIYMLGYNYPIIVCLDVNTDEVININDWIDGIDEDEDISEYDGYFCRGYALRENKLYLPMGRQKSLLEICTNDNSTRIINLDIESQGIGGISQYDDNTFLLVGQGKKSASIMVYDVQSKRIIAQRHVDPINDLVFEAFWPPVVHGKDVYLIPYKCLEFDYAFKYNITNNEITIDDKLSELIHPQVYNNSDNLYMIYQAGALSKVDADTIRFVRGEDLKWFEYNLKTREFEEYFIEMDISEDEYEKLYANWMKSYVGYNMPIPEKIFPLEGFIKLVQDKEV